MGNAQKRPLARGVPHAAARWGKTEVWRTQETAEIPAPRVRRGYSGRFPTVEEVPR